MSTHIDFTKGHGTENDFIVVPDPEGALGEVLDAPTIRWLTDRYAGIGGDGLIRAVRTARVPEVAHLADVAEWFMDYRNADGSAAEMCGNGVRVLARYLFDHDLASGSGQTLTVATRGGPRTVHAEPDGQYTVEMGKAERLGSPAPEGGSAQVTVSMGDRTWGAVPVAVPNPHAVVFLDGGGGPRDASGAEHGDGSLALLDQLGMLTSVPALSPAGLFPDGANVEFVVNRGQRHIALRVWERGVGETRSCGTGVCAAAWAAMRRDGASDEAYTVDVPGGRLRVTEYADGELHLTGPAVLGIRGSVEMV